MTVCSIRNKGVLLHLGDCFSQTHWERRPEIMFCRWILAVGLTLAICSTGIAQQNTRDGAVVGGATGAIIGGIIGHQNDETPEGAIIGGVVGAVAGGLLGKNRDQQIAREQYYQNQMYQQQQQINQMSRPCVTSNDVITMCRNGVGEQVIINYVQTDGVDRRLNVSEIIALHQQGVSENIISAMQNAPVGQQGQVAPPPTYRQATMPQQPQTVIIREQYEVVRPPVIYQAPPPPVFYFEYGRGHHHYHR
ncbi:MAG: glycine zipper domain-containing protein [Pirellulaceae bacterium]